MAKTKDTPQETVLEDGTPAFSQARLIRDSEQMLGVPRHVAAGALHSVNDPYLTVADAKQHVRDYGAREV